MWHEAQVVLGGVFHRDGSHPALEAIDQGHGEVRRHTHLLKLLCNICVHAISGSSVACSNHTGPEDTLLQWWKTPAACWGVGGGLRQHNGHHTSNTDAIVEVNS